MYSSPLYHLVGAHPGGGEEEEAEEGVEVVVAGVEGGASSEGGDDPPILQGEAQATLEDLIPIPADQQTPPHSLQ